MQPQLLVRKDVCSELIDADREDRLAESASRLCELTEGGFGMLRFKMGLWVPINCSLMLICRILRRNRSAEPLSFRLRLSIDKVWMRRMFGFDHVSRIRHIRPFLLEKASETFMHPSVLLLELQYLAFQIFHFFIAKTELSLKLSLRLLCSVSFACGERQYRSLARYGS